jgi:serine/threonine-protein kinase
MLGAPSASEAPTFHDRPTPPVATSPLPLPQPLRTLGKYELLEQLAQGGMGVVYKARHMVLDRVVALKRIRSGAWAHAEEVKRFHTEARAIAQLDNPNIVPVYEVDECEGQHYFTMRFAPGGNLAPAATWPSTKIVSAPTRDSPLS